MTKIDTTKQTIDTTIIGKSFVHKTITIEKTINDKSDYFSKSLDFVGVIAWPLSLIIVIILLKKHIVILLNIISDKIRDSKSFSISSKGVEVTSATIEIPLDKSTGQDIFPDFPLTDDQSKKILSTMWIHQNEYDKNFSTRWTFTLGDNSQDYMPFQQSATRLQWLGLITLDSNSRQLFLTDIGLKYCEKNKDKLGTFSYFKK